MIFMKTQSNFYLFLIALISAMGGFLFGYDWVVIGGAKPFYEQYFGIAGNPVMQGWAMSSAPPGRYGSPGRDRCHFPPLPHTGFRSGPV